MTEKNDAESTESALSKLEKELNDTSKETVTSQSEPSKSPPLSGRKRSSDSKQNGRSVFVSSLVIVNFLLLLGLIGAAVWAWLQWQNKQVEQDGFFAQQQEQLNSQNKLNDDLLNSLREQNQAMQLNIETLTSELQSAAAQQEALQKQVADVSGRRPSDWLLAEADYLVRMAGRKLWLEQDLRTAVLMLQSADSRLQDTGDPSLLPIRELIAQDIQTLKQINPVSLPSIALAVSGMVKQVKSLPLALPEIPEIKQQKTQVTDSVLNWRENLSSAWNFFREDLIDYQPRTQPIRQLMTPQQQWIAREQLKLALLQAQQAALDEQPTLYQQSLQNAIDLLVTHFDLQEPGVEQFLASVNNLEQTNIERIYPSQLSASQPLQDILQNRVTSVFSNEVNAL